jgi:cob(I)alamin adenosyltransferase
MKIYTKTGDKGETGLFGGERVKKSHARVDAYGEVDELNSVIGLVRSEPIDAALDALFARVQANLFNVGAELATPAGSKVELGIDLIGEADVLELELAIDRAESELLPLKTFVLPGGCRAAALLHLGRTVCRRAERRLVALSDDEPVRGECIRYLNRLSDALFVLARLANHRAGVADVPWIGKGQQRA